jgi:hypothetical protein
METDLINQSSTTQLDPNPDFWPIDDPDNGLPMLTRALLMLGQILTAKEPSIELVPLPKVRFLISKHINKIKIQLSAKEIRDCIMGEWGEVRGGGVLVEWMPGPGANCNSRNQYLFTFRRLYRPEDYIVNASSSSPQT